MKPPKLAPAIRVGKKKLPMLAIGLVLVVGAPLGILSVLTRAMTAFSEDCERCRTASAMDELVTAFPAWRANNRDATCPADLLDLGTDASARDQWGRDLRYRCTNDRLEVTSAGPDERFGTVDDLTVATR